MTTKKIKYGIEDFERDHGPFTFGSILEGYRLSEEISQKDFAKFLGISQASLCDLEKGRRIPSVERAASIARKIGHPEALWVTYALQDHLNEAGLKLKVSVA